MVHELLGVPMLAAIAIAAVAGWVRGITGFGAAMVMTPPLSLMLGPQLAVPITLMLEAFAAAPMLPAATRTAHWRVLTPILLAAIGCVPLGAYVLATADPDTLRRGIALIVIIFSTLLLSGARYHGKQRLATSIGLGSLSGAMLGATSIGGPPVILYLLAGPDPVAVSRANLTLYVALSSAVGLMALLMRGVVDARVLLHACAMAPLFMVGVVVGSRAFARLSDLRFRRFTIILMLVVSLVVLIV
jgi:uncharacterized membrane protein YfcA